MDGHSYGKKDEEYAQCPMICDEYRAVQQGDPEHRYRYYLDSQRDSLVFPEVLDIWSQFRMVHEPDV